MKKANFDMLKNLPVPEGWIENALAIPEQEEKKNAVVPFWKNRAVVAAASLVLVSALSLLLYLNFGVKPPVEVKSSAPATEIIWSTDENGETVATEIVIIPERETRSDGNYQDGTQPTEPKSPIEQLIEQIFGTENTSPTTTLDSGSGRGRTNPTTKTNPIEGGWMNLTTKPGSNLGSMTDPTTKYDSTEGSVPLVYPTLPQTVDPTYAPDMTEAPTPYETIPSIIDPTYAPDCTEPVDDPETPTQPVDDPETPTQPVDDPEIPTQPWTADLYNQAYHVISKDKLPQSSAFYCKIYDENWVLCGDENLYSKQHKAQVIEKDNSYWLAYVPGDHGVITKKGYYYFRFYDADGWETPTYGNFMTVADDPVSDYYRTTVSEIRYYDPRDRGASNVYFRIYNRDWELLGDQDIYSSQHEARMIQIKEDEYLFIYTPKDYGILPEDGLYYYKFYTDKGSLMTGSDYLYAK